MALSQSELKKLTAEWDRKLKEAGFEDIESRNEVLKDYHSLRFIKQGRSALDLLSLQSKESYYRSAEQFLHRHKFESPIDKIVWKLHSEGVSFRNIAKQVKDLKTVSYGTVKKIVHRLTKNMEESWKRQQE